MKDLLKLYSASKGIIKIKDFFLEFSDTLSTGHNDKEFVVDFPYENVEVIVNQEDLSPLLYTTGYIARKLIRMVHCEECKRLFCDNDKPFDLDIDEQHLVYFQCLDRGGLIYPSNLLFNITQCSYSIFNMCVSSSLECSFIKVDNQKQTLVNTIERYLSNCDDFLAVYYMCEDCDTTLLTYLVNALGCFSNILLNNYSKIHTDKLGSAKQSKKLSKLN